MHKRYFPLALPKSVKETIAYDAPVNSSNYDTNLEWQSRYNNTVYQNSLFFKGPLLSIMPKFSGRTEPSSIVSLNIYKRFVKKSLLTIQANGDDEWRAINFPLYNIPGIRRAPTRRANNITHYQE